jgi:hypothetical protein
MLVSKIIIKARETLFAKLEIVQFFVIAVITYGREFFGLGDWIMLSRECFERRFKGDCHGFALL